MSAVATWPTLPADQLPRDPWPHERGEDPGHLLDPSGHVPHRIDSTAHLIGDPEPFVVRTPRPASPAATYLIGSEMVAFVVVALLVLAGALPGVTG